MTAPVYEPKRGDLVFDTRAQRRGVVSSVHTGGMLLGPAVSVEPAAGALGGHWWSAPEHLRLMERVETDLTGGRGNG